LGLYFLKVGLQIGFGGFNLQASTGVALTYLAEVDLPDITGAK
jgi:hypothetical protein